jgi:hypothetical protein
MRIGTKQIELARHSGQAKRDPESRPRLNSRVSGYRIKSGMTAQEKGLKAVFDFIFTS